MDLSATLNNEALRLVSGTMKSSTEGIKHFPLTRILGKYLEEGTDVLAIEEPLEIRLGFGSERRRERVPLSVTMRTPGNDFELVTGFLLSEGIIGKREDILQIQYLGEEGENIVLAELHPSLLLDMDRFRRHFYSGSSCGVCGKSSLESVHCHSPFLLRPESPRISMSLLAGLPELIRTEQALFAQTGGAHAAALFDAKGKLICLREDVGRHNAVDKVIGYMLKCEQLPLSEALLLVSGRAGFEIVQKAFMAGIPVLASVGAPSSLAVELADSAQMTLAGFLRNGACNIYTGIDRIMPG